MNTAFIEQRRRIAPRILPGAVSLMVVYVLAACGDDPSSSTAPDKPAEGVTDGCGSVRMTYYNASDRRWCGFDRTHPALPDFVRNGMTVAVAEPYSGSSYEGDSGEACGECWQISTTFATQLIMVHDLCPIDGNPVCAGGHFHFDVSSETADVLDGGEWLGEGSVIRVPCPVTGNIHIHVTARNQYGYLQLAFFNHRIPIRQVEYRAADGNDWRPLTRCLARWCLDDDTTTFASGGPGGVFRITSADAEVVEGNTVLTTAIKEGDDFDTGIQFMDSGPVTANCPFVPPGEVYDDIWGGIEGVRWEPNTWGETSLSEINDGCADASESCVRLGNFKDSGVHITYRHVFPVDTFGTLSLQLRTSRGDGTVEVAPRSRDARCSSPTVVQVSERWTTAIVDMTQSCPDADWIHGLTISRSSGQMDLLVDNIQFQ